jgi:hypothetical protein
MVDINSDDYGYAICGPCPVDYMENFFKKCVRDVCKINNGGCDPLTTCTMSSGGTRRCGMCPWPQYDTTYPNQGDDFTVKCVKKSSSGAWHGLATPADAVAALAAPAAVTTEATTTIPMVVAAAALPALATDAAPAAGMVVQDEFPGMHEVTDPGSCGRDNGGCHHLRSCS